MYDFVLGAFIATLGCMQPAGHGLNTPAPETGVAGNPRGHISQLIAPLRREVCHLLHTLFWAFWKSSAWGRMQVFRHGPQVFLSAERQAHTYEKPNVGNDSSP